MDELKLCPFCGAKAEVYQTIESRWVIECLLCFARSWARDSKEEAIKAWNRRAKITDGG